MGRVRCNLCFNPDWSHTSHKTWNLWNYSQEPPLNLVLTFLLGSLFCCFVIFVFLSKPSATELGSSWELQGWIWPLREFPLTFICLGKMAMKAIHEVPQLNTSFYFSGLHLARKERPVFVAIIPSVEILRKGLNIDNQTVPPKELDLLLLWKIGNIPLLAFSSLEQPVLAAVAKGSGVLVVTDVKRICGLSPFPRTLRGCVILNILNCLGIEQGSQTLLWCRGLINGVLQSRRSGWEVGRGTVLWPWLSVDLWRKPSPFLNLEENQSKPNKGKQRESQKHFQLEKSSKIIESNRSPSSAKAMTKPCPQVPHPHIF